MKKLLGKSLVMLLALMFTLQIVPMTAYADDSAAAAVPDAQEIIAQMSEEASDDAEIAAIVCEDVSARTANEKQYLLEDGSYLLTQYDVPVHYENENGELVDIDNTLTYDAAENAQDFDGYENRANSFNVKFADGSGERIFNFTEDGYTIGLELADGAADGSEAVIESGEPAVQTLGETVEERNAQMAALDNLTSMVSYDSALDGADLEYTVLPNGIKEDIVVNTRQSEYSYSFILNTDNLSLVQNDDGSISLMSDDGETPEEKYHIPAPYMIDANNRISFDASYQVAAAGEGRYVLTVSADEEWINDTDTVLPVRIDPSVIKSYSTAFIDDAYILSGSRYANTNGSTGTLLLLGKQTGMGYARSFFKINLASIPDGTEKIKSAKLHLDMRFSQNPRSAVNIVCKRPLEEWDYDTVTWNSQPELDSKIIDYKVFAADATTLDIDITKPLAHDYYNDTDLGFALVCENETENLPALSIGSVRHANAEYQPSVEVVFNKQKGLDSNQMYLPIDCGQYGRAYINAYNGDLTYVHKIFDSDNGIVKMNCVYNQYMANADYAYENEVYYPKNVSYGNNWKLMPIETLIPITENELGTQTMTASTEDDADVNYGYAYLYNDMYGNNIFLTAAGNDGLVYTFKDQSGRNYTLTVNRANDAGTLIDTGYSLTTPDGTVKGFSIVKTGVRRKGYISSSVKNRKVTAYSYVGSTSEKVSAINHTSSTKTIALSYNTVGAKDYISSIAYDGTNKATFTYENITGGNTNISAIQNVGVGRAMFGYNGSGKLLTVREVDGARLNFEYNGYGKLTAVIWKKNNSAASVRIEFAYDLGTTVAHFFGEDATAATEDDIIVRYQFDASGKSIGAHPLTVDGRIHERTVDTTYESFEDIASINGDGAYAYYMENAVNASSDATIGRWTNLVLSTDEHYLGNYSYKLSSTKSYSYLDRFISLESGQHTFSAYVKCIDGMTSTVDGQTVYEPIVISAGDACHLLTKGSFTDVTVTDANISEHMTPESASSNKIIPQRIYKTDAAVNNGWQKITCSFNIEYDENNEYECATDAPAVMSVGISANGSGAFYVDEISIDGQLLTWYSDSNVRISSGFESSDIYWETGNCPYTRVTKDANKIIRPAYAAENAEYSPENVLFGEYSFKIEGDPNDDDKALYHTEYLNTTDITSYALKLSGWGKANSLPISGPNAPQGFELFAYYVYYVTTADGASEMRTASTAVPFNWQIDDWQYVSKELNLPTAGEGETISNVYSVTFGVLYKGNRNTAYFDNVELAYVD